MIVQLLILHKLLHKYLNATEQIYQPDWEELSALHWFMYQRSGTARTVKISWE